jgi:hypothetical protein
LQMFGYTIALSGLIWYKIGGDQAQAMYLKLTGDDDTLINRFRRSLWAKIGAGALILFVFLAMTHGLSRGGGINTASTHTGLTGVPEPEMAYNPGEYTTGHHHEVVEPLDGLLTDPTHYADDHPSPPPSEHISHGPVGQTVGHQPIGQPGHLPPAPPVSQDTLDIVIYISPSSINENLTTFSAVTSLPEISAMSPNIISYAAANHVDLLSTQAVIVGSINSASAAFLHYISTHYDNLPRHTMFLHTGADALHVSNVISTRFTPQSGVVELSRGGYGDCLCTDCVDSFNTTARSLPKASELYSLTNQNICSPNDRLLVHCSPNMLMFS